MHTKKKPIGHRIGEALSSLSQTSIQRNLCMSILRLLESGKIHLSGRQLAFVEEIKESCIPVGEVRIRILRSFINRYK